MLVCQFGPDYQESGIAPKRATGARWWVRAPQKKRTCLRPLRERALLVARKTHAPAGEGHQQPPHTMGDVRPHGYGKARPVLGWGYAPDGGGHTPRTVRNPCEMCVAGLRAAMNGV